MLLVENFLFGISFCFFCFFFVRTLNVVEFFMLKHRCAFFSCSQDGSNPSNYDNKSMINGWLTARIVIRNISKERLKILIHDCTRSHSKRVQMKIKKIPSRNLRDRNVQHELNCSAIHTLDFASSYSHVEMSHRIRHMGHSSQLGSVTHRTTPIKLTMLPKSMWNS